jgi:alpha 1,3-glucosidase
MSTLCFLYALNRLKVIEKTAELVSVESGTNRVIVHAIPFHVDLFSGDELVISVNARGLMRFEHIRLKPEQ